MPCVVSESNDRADLRISKMSKSLTSRSYYEIPNQENSRNERRNDKEHIATDHEPDIAKLTHSEENQTNTITRKADKTAVHHQHLTIFTVRSTNT